MTPEIAGVVPATGQAAVRRIFVGGRGSNVAGFAGKIDEIAVYDRALSPEEIARQHALAVASKP